MPCKNGAELVAKLKESGTPDHLLEPARRVLADVHQESKRIATCREVCVALHEAHGEDHGTVKKARVIAETGELPKSGGAASGPPIEDVLLAQAEKEAAERADQALKAEKDAADKATKAMGAKVQAAVDAADKATKAASKAAATAAAPPAAAKPTAPASSAAPVSPPADTSKSPATTATPPATA